MKALGHHSDRTGHTQQITTLPVPTDYRFLPYSAEWWLYFEYVHLYSKVK